MNELSYYLLSAVAVVIALTCHEFAHAMTATKLGDPTPAAYGRLSLNPLRHIDPLGALAMLLFRFGWAKPVPINPRNFRRPRGGMALTAVAGPITNVLLAFLTCFLYLLAVSLYGSVAEIFAPRSLGFRIYLTLIDFLAIFHTLNLSFAVFNLLPISPLDGSRLLYLFLPRRAHRWFVEHERVIYFGVLAWLFLGDRFYQLLLRLQPIAASPALSALASIFSPAVWLSRIIQPLSSLMVRFWTLLPFLA